MKDEKEKINRRAVLEQNLAMVAALGLENDLRMSVEDGRLDDAVLLRPVDGKEVSACHGEAEESMYTLPEGMGEDGESRSEMESQVNECVQALLAKRKPGRPTGRRRKK